MKNAPFLHRFEYALYLGVKAKLRCLPHAASRWLGAFLGELGYHLVSRRRRVALENLERIFPELSPGERRRLARASFRHFGSALCDSVSAARLDPVALCRRLELEGWEHLERARRSGPSLCYMTAHFGTWEITADVVGLYTGGLDVVARRLDNPHLDRELRRQRSRHGNELIEKRGSIRRMLRTLRGGGQLGILIDQRVQAYEGIVVSFLGQPAVASPVLARLALRTGSPVVPLFAYPEPGGRYRLVVEPAIEPGHTEGDDATAALTRRLLEPVEKHIRERPELWMWMHDRWKI